MAFRRRMRRSPGAGATRQDYASNHHLLNAGVASLEAVFERLRRYTRIHNPSLRDVARAVVAGRGFARQILAAATADAGALSS
jgi:hypothetical protein